jgi:thiosulfate sulfurtransferase
METSFKNITIDDAKVLIEKNAVIVDIRDEASYLEGHLEGAIHLTEANLPLFIQQNDFDNPIVIYCYHGHSSQHAADFLSKQGFDEVYSVLGGYTAWGDNTGTNK